MPRFYSRARSFGKLCVALAIRAFSRSTIRDLSCGKENSPGGSLRGCRDSFED